MLWSIDTFQDKVSADQYHFKSRGHLAGSGLGLIGVTCFFEVEVLFFYWIARLEPGQFVVIRAPLLHYKVDSRFKILKVFGDHLGVIKRRAEGPKFISNLSYCHGSPSLNKVFHFTSLQRDGTRVYHARYIFMRIPVINYYALHAVIPSQSVRQAAADVLW